MKLQWKKIKEEPYKAGRYRMVKTTFVLPGGEEAIYDLRDQGITASVVGLTQENKVVLVKIFRPGPEKVLAEIPGGFVDEGEDPQKAAERELLEETGYSGELELAGSTIDDAYSNLVRYVYVARNCQKVKEPEREFDEFMEVVEVSLEEFRDHLRSGQLTDAELGYLALDYLKLL